MASLYVIYFALIKIYKESIVWTLWQKDIILGERLQIPVPSFHLGVTNLWPIRQPTDTCNPHCFLFDSEHLGWNMQSLLLVVLDSHRRLGNLDLLRAHELFRTLQKLLIIVKYLCTHLKKKIMEFSKSSSWLADHDVTDRSHTFQIPF